MIKNVRLGLKNVFNIVRPFIFLGFVLLIALVFVVNTLASRKISTSDRSLQAILTPTTPTNQSVLTTGWRVYESSDLGFSVQFPDGWYYEENPDFQQPMVVTEALEVKTMFADFPPPFLGPTDSIPDGCRFNILVATTEKDPQQVFNVDKYKNPASLSSPSAEASINVNGVEGTRITYFQNDKDIQHDQTVILLPGSNSIFAIHFWNEREEIQDACANTFATMLQSFTITK